MPDFRNLKPEDLLKLDHATLYNARAKAPPDMQNVLAGPEHRAFAREATAENPALALSIALASLAYQPYKILKGQARSDPSMTQAMQGIAGVGEGLGIYGAEKVEQIKNLLSGI